MDNKRYFSPSTRHLSSMNDETRETRSWMTSIDSDDSKPRTVGRLRAVTVICPIDLTARDQYDNLSTIIKIEYVQHHQCTHKRAKRPSFNRMVTNSDLNAHMLDRPTN